MGLFTNRYNNTIPFDRVIKVRAVSTMVHVACVVGRYTSAVWQSSCLQNVPGWIRQSTAGRGETVASDWPQDVRAASGLWCGHRHQVAGPAGSMGQRKGTLRNNTVPLMLTYPQGVVVYDTGLKEVISLIKFDEER